MGNFDISPHFRKVKQTTIIGNVIECLSNKTKNWPNRHCILPYPKIREYTIFLSTYGTYTNMDYELCQKKPPSMYSIET